MRDLTCCKRNGRACLDRVDQDGINGNDHRYWVGGWDVGVMGLI